MGFGDWVGDRINDVKTAVHDAGATVLGYDTMAEKEAKERAEKASKAGERERGQLDQRNQALQDEVYGFDPPGISQCVNWSSFSHAEIYRTNQDTIKEAQANEVGDAWVKFGKALRERGEKFDTKLKEIISGGWQGEAAEQAKTLGEPVRKWMEGSGAAFEMTGNNLKTVSSAAGQVKATVPEPEGHSWGRTAVATIAAGPFGAGGDALAQMKEREEAEKAAQETMARVYSPTFTNVDAQMPKYQTPEGRTVCPPPVPPPPPTDWGRGMGDPGGLSNGSVTGGGGPGGTGGGPGGYSGVGSGGPGGHGGGYGSGGGGGYTPPSQTGSQWASDDPTKLPGPGTFGPGGPGGGAGSIGSGGGAAAMVGGLGAGGAGAAGLGRGAAGAGGMAAGGRAGAGGLGAGGGTGAGATGAAGAAGARGAGGARGMMGGMGAGARGGKGGEDEEHERPSWLEEQDDIWMNDMPKTAPPVLGE